MAKLAAGVLGGLLGTVTFSTTGAPMPATYLSPAAISGLREMQSSSAQPGSITITNGGGASGVYTLSNTGGNSLTFGTSSGNLAALGGSLVEPRLGFHYDYGLAEWNHYVDRPDER